MDLDDEWEFLPDARYLRHDLHHNHEGDDLVVGKRVFHHNRSSSPPGFAAKSNCVFNMDYFSDPSPPPPSKLLIIPTPVHFRSPSLEAQDVVRRLLQAEEKIQEEEEVEEVKTTTAMTQQSSDTPVASQVFFKSNILKETNEFVDMKKIVDSPRSNPVVIGNEFRFEEKSGDDNNLVLASSPKHNNNNSTKLEFDFPFDEKNNKDQHVVNSNIQMKNDVNWIGEGIIGDDMIIDDGNDDGIMAGLNLWKLGFGGIGAICSFGVAAATICILIFGNSQKANKHHNHKLRFQIYADDKRIKQVVQQATRINEAMSAAVRGVPLNRAHITYGGYYDSAL